MLTKLKPIARPNQRIRTAIASAARSQRDIGSTSGTCVMKGLPAFMGRILPANRRALQKNRAGTGGDPNRPA